MDTLKKVLTQSSWQLIAKVITSLFTTLLIFLIAQPYGEFGIGVFTLALTFLSFFYLAIDGGINAHLLPDLMPKDPHLVWRKLLGMRLLTAVLFIFICILLVLLLPSHSPAFQLAVIFGSLSILASAIFSSTTALFQAKLQYNYSAAATTLSTMFGAALMLYPISQKVPIQYLIIPQTLGWFSCAFLALFLAKKSLSVLTPIFDHHFILNTLKQTWPITVTLILNTIYFRIDAFILSSLKTFEDVGIYNLSYTIFQSALVLPTYIMNSYYPLMIQSHAQNRLQFIKEFKIASLALLTVGVLASLATLLFSPLAIAILTRGQGFTGAVETLNLLSIGFPAYFLPSLLMWALVLYMKYRSLMVIYLLGLVINLLANFLLIPPYSYLGAAVATSVSEYLILLLQLIILYKVIKK